MIPNRADAAHDGQARPSAADWNILEAARMGRGVIGTGCAVTQRAAGANMSVDVAAGSVVIAGAEVAIAGGNEVVSAADSTYDRYDLVVARDDGSVVVLAGDPEPIALLPEPASDEVGLAGVYVVANATQVINADIVNKRLEVDTPTSSVLWTPVRKASSTNRTSTTTLAADPDLQIPMVANGEYAIRGVLHISVESATPDFKWRHVGPASPVRIRVYARMQRVGLTTIENIRSDSAYSAADILYDFTAAWDAMVDIEAIIHNGANAGDFEVQWAPNASSADDCIMLAASYLEYARVDA